MNLRKCKALRKLTASLFKDLPEISYKKNVRPVNYGTKEKPRILDNEVWFLEDCQRRRYKQMKKFYKMQKKRGLHA